MPRTHFTWSIEGPRGLCSECNGETALVIADGEWKVDYESPLCDSLGGYAEIREEITGHYCPNCRKLVSLSLNTMD